MGLYLPPIVSNVQPMAKKHRHLFPTPLPTFVRRSVLLARGAETEDFVIRTKSEKPGFVIILMRSNSF